MAKIVTDLTPAAYQPGSLPGVLSPSCDGQGNLILERAWRLDAFSAYRNRAWLPSTALESTTGTPEARPSRSSRHSVFPNYLQ